MKKLIVILPVLLLLLTFSGCTNNANTETTEQSEQTSDITTETIETQFEWQKDTPENHNISSSIFTSLHNQFDNTEIQACVTVRDDYIIDEYYKDSYDASSIFSLYSCSKSITSALVGIAIDKGLIESTDVLISEYFPEIEANGSEYQKQITIWHLLTHTSGIDMSDDANWNEWIASDHWVQYILDRPVTSEPGTVFSYSTGNSHLLCAILQEATGMSVYEFGQKYLFEPLGMESVQCNTDPQGITDGGNGFQMNVYDMLKIGRLYLNKGNWQGEQIVSSDWIEASTSIQFIRDSGSADYGYQWWVRQFEGHSAYFAQGHFGQFIFVVPDFNLIIAFTSHNTGRTSMYWQFVNTIVANCGS